MSDEGEAGGHEGSDDARSEPLEGAPRSADRDSTLDLPSASGPPLTCPACERTVTQRNARFCAACGHRFANPSFERIEERTDVADPLVGRTLADRYLLAEVIGRGGMGVVYRVEHTRIGKAMALKLLHGELARDRAVVRRFRREAETASKLDHPNTVQIFDFGQSDGLTFLVMELLSGEDLGEILYAEGTLPFSRVAHIAAQICGSVAQAHDRGIVHRDLKPENVRILHDRATPDFAKVLDFGLAKLRDSTALAGASITRHGMLVGTPYYMAPELIRGEPTDHRVDVYAMGCMLYKSVVGVPPFWASSPMAVLTKHLTDDAAPPTVRSPRRDLDPSVDRIVMRALAKDPARRYPSMRALRDDLDAYLEAQGVDRSAPARSSGEAIPATTPAVVSATARTLTLARPAANAPERPVVAATRDEVERFERRLRARSVVLNLALAGLVLAGSFGGYFAWARRAPPAPTAPTSEVEPNDEPGQADELPEALAVRGQLGRRIDRARGDEDVFAFDVPAGVESVSLTVTALPNVDLAVDVFAFGRSEPLVVLDSMPLGGPEEAPNLPLSRGRYLARVHEVRIAGRFPIENVSDSYTIMWRRVARRPDDEREWNDAPSQAEVLELANGAAARSGYIGWGGDVDTFCVDGVSAPLTAELTRIPSLDLAITASFEGRELQRDEAARGEGERLLVPGARAPRRVCFRAQASPSTPQRGDAAARYTLRLREGDRD